MAKNGTAATRRLADALPGFHQRVLYAGPCQEEATERVAAYFKREKLAYYLDHPEETTAIAAAGHAHLRRYHTASARAGQLLGRIEQVLGIHEE